LVKQVLDTHFLHVKAHHDNEEEFFFPELRTKCPMPDPVPAHLINDHEAMKKCADCATYLCDQSPVPWLELSQIWNLYEEFMRRHFVDEEKVVLPLMRKHFEPIEIKPKVGAWMGRHVHESVASLQGPAAKKNPGGAIEMGANIHYMNKTEFKFTKFVKQEEMPEDQAGSMCQLEGMYKSMMINVIDQLEEAAREKLQ